MMARNYVYPKLGRAGLGNELFPVARSWELIEERPGWRLLPPKWFGMRLGPYMRGDRDKREYWKLFRLGALSDRLARFLLVNLRLGSMPILSRLCNVVVVEGMDGYFGAFGKNPQFFRNKLLTYARSSALASSAPVKVYVGVHVRRGDFQPADDSSDLLTTNNSGTSTAWYAAQMLAARSRLGAVNFVVASDGSDAEIADVLAIPGVRRAEGNALEDILVLSESAGLIGCRSTFTAWAAFLGEVPLLLPPGGNAYSPHSLVFEVGRSERAEEWFDAVGQRIAERKGS